MPRARGSLANQGIKQGAAIAEAPGHITGGARQRVRAFDFSSVEQCPAELAPHAAAEDGFAGAQGEEHRFEQLYGGAFAADVGFHLLYAQGRSCQVGRRTHLKGERRCLLERRQAISQTLGPVERVTQRQQQFEHLAPRLRQIPRQLQAAFEMRGGCRCGKSGQGALSRPQPMRHRLLRQCRRSIVLSDDFWLNGIRLECLQGTGDIVMVLAAARQQERLIGRLLD